MIKGLISGQNILFNAAEFLYAQVDSDGGESFFVIIHCKDGRRVTAYIGGHENCVHYLEGLELR